MESMEMATAVLSLALSLSHPALSVLVVTFLPSSYTEPFCWSSAMHRRLFWFCHIIFLRRGSWKCNRGGERSLHCVCWYSRRPWERQCTDKCWRLWSKSSQHNTKITRYQGRRAERRTQYHSWWFTSLAMFHSFPCLCWSSNKLIYIFYIW